ncbi:MAG: hypothetical protein ACXIUQ_14775 [Cecembia sp.]
MKNILSFVLMAFLPALISAQTIYPLYGDQSIPNSIDGPGEEKTEIGCPFIFNQFSRNQYNR